MSAIVSRAQPKVASEKRASTLAAKLPAAVTSVKKVSGPASASASAAPASPAAPRPSPAKASKSAPSSNKKESADASAKAKKPRVVPREARFYAKRDNHHVIITARDSFTVNDRFDLIAQDSSIKAQTLRRGPTCSLAEFDSDESDSDNDSDDEEESDSDSDSDDEEESDSGSDDEGESDSEGSEGRGGVPFQPISAGTLALHGRAVWTVMDKRRSRMEKVDPKLDNLLVHQQDALDAFAGKQQVSLLCWELGAGKTLGGLSIAAATAALATTSNNPRRIVIVCPISLIAQWAVYVMLKPHPLTCNEPIVYDVIGSDEWERMADEQDDRLYQFIADHVSIIVVDEMQRYRRATNGRSQGLSMYHCANAILYLTGTPFVNDTTSLLGFCACMANVTRTTSLHSLSELWSAFAGDAMEDEESVMRLPASRVGSALRNRVSFFTPADFAPYAHQYPCVHSAIVHVPMTPAQLFNYLAYRATTFSVTIERETYTVQLGKTGNSANIGLLQNADMPFAPAWSRSPKIHAMVERIRSHSYPQVVFTRFVDNGVEPVVLALRALLRLDATQVVSLTGKTPSSARGEMIQRFNMGRLPILVLSRAGATGVDLQGAVAFHALGAFDNDEEKRQAQGRVERFGSHKRKPSTQRRIHIYNYVIQFPSRAPSSLTDSERSELLQALASWMGDVSLREGDPRLSVMAGAKTSARRQSVANSLYQNLVAQAAEQQTTIDEKMMQEIDEKRRHLTPYKEILRRVSVPMVRTEAWAAANSPHGLTMTHHDHEANAWSLRRALCAVDWPLPARAARTAIPSWERWSKQWPTVHGISGTGWKRTEWPNWALDAVLVVSRALNREGAPLDLPGDVVLQRVLQQLREWMDGSGSAPKRSRAGGSVGGGAGGRLADPTAVVEEGMRALKIEAKKKKKSVAVIRLCL
jgi:superfamily II DNA or RNA helicase